MYLPATVETTFDRRRAAIYNLSSNGAQVSVDLELRAGNDVLLKCGTIDALCTVMWTKGNVCGLEFDEPLSEAQVLATRSYANGTSERQRTERLAGQRTGPKAAEVGRPAFRLQCDMHIHLILLRLESRPGRHCYQCPGLRQGREMDWTRAGRSLLIWQP